MVYTMHSVHYHVLICLGKDILSDYKYGMKDLCHGKYSSKRMHVYQYYRYVLEKTFFTDNRFGTRYKDLCHGKQVSSTH